MEGEFAYFGFDLQQFDQSAADAVYLQAYVCLDVSNVAYFNADGADESAEDHAISAPLEVIFVNEPSNPDQLLLDLVEPWTGANFCA